MLAMLPTDADLLTALLPELDGEAIPDDVQKEYDKLIRLHHLVRSGPLGIDALSAMLRSLGYEAPEATKNNDRVNWREVPPGVAVMAKDELGWKRGELVDCIDDGRVCVRFPGDEYVYEFASYDMQLIDEDGPVVDEGEPVPTKERDSADLTRDGYLPVMEGDWSMVLCGAAVIVETDDDLIHAEFIEVGPKDGEISVYVNGELQVHHESKVTVAD